MRKKVEEEARNEMVRCYVLMRAYEDHSIAFKRGLSWYNWHKKRLDRLAKFRELLILLKDIIRSRRH